MAHLFCLGKDLRSGPILLTVNSLDTLHTSGDLVHVSVFGRHIIILNSPAVIDDLFEKRGHIYSERPTLPMAGEM